MTNAEFNEIFRKRTLDFAVRTIKFLDTLPKGRTADVISYQLGKSSTSVGANFRAFCRGRSKAEKYSKICIVVEESDESEYWYLVIKNLGWGDHNELNYLLVESVEILKVVSKIKQGLK